jgi:sialic acid synthase SpsE
VIILAKIILDFGSGNTNKNNWDYTKKMIDELKAVDTGKHEVIIKWQLFLEAGKNIPLTQWNFNRAYNYAKELGYKTTSSVFDKESLDFLLQFDVPFVKIANNRKLDWLIGEVPRNVPIYLSISENSEDPYFHIDHLPPMVMIPEITTLACVSDYPADILKYENKFNRGYLRAGISDHTTNWDLFNKYKPEIIEVHYGLEDSTGLDAGPFMRTPSALKEVL